MVSAALPKLVPLLQSEAHRLTFSTKKSRILGFYMHGKDGREVGMQNKEKWQRINLQVDLPPYKMLLVLLHEWAHLKTFKLYPSSRPHGKEWKNEFAKVLKDFISPEIFPEPIVPLLKEYYSLPSKIPAIWDQKIDSICCFEFGSTRKEFFNYYIKKFKEGVFYPAPSTMQNYAYRKFSLVVSSSVLSEPIFGQNAAASVSSASVSPAVQPAASIADVAAPAAQPLDKRPLPLPTTALLASLAQNTIIEILGEKFTLEKIEGKYAICKNLFSGKTAKILSSMKVKVLS